MQDRKFINRALSLHLTSTPTSTHIASYHMYTLQTMNSLECNKLSSSLCSICHRKAYENRWYRTADHPTNTPEPSIVSFGPLPFALYFFSVLSRPVYGILFNPMPAGTPRNQVRTIHRGNDDEADFETQKARQRQKKSKGRTSSQVQLKRFIPRYHNLTPRTCPPSTPLARQNINTIRAKPGYALRTRIAIPEHADSPTTSAVYLHGLRLQQEGRAGV